MKNVRILKKSKPVLCECVVRWKSWHEDYDKGDDAHVQDGARQCGQEPHPGKPRAPLALILQVSFFWG